MLTSARQFELLVLACAGQGLVHVQFRMMVHNLCGRIALAKSARGLAPTVSGLDMNGAKCIRIHPVHGIAL